MNSSPEDSNPGEGQIPKVKTEELDEECSQKRIRTRSMTIREREDELGPEAAKHRDAIFEILQKKQHFMDIGDIASHAVCGGLVKGPVVTVEGIFGKVIAMEIARGRDAMLKRSLDGGYGLKDWSDETDDSQSTIPDDEMDTNEVKTSKGHQSRSKPRHYHVLEGHPWQPQLPPPQPQQRFGRMLPPWAVPGGMLHHKQNWMAAQNFTSPKENGMGCWGRGFHGCNPPRPLWNGDGTGMSCGGRKVPNIMNIPLSDIEASHGVMGEECPIDVQIASFDEKDEQFEQNCFNGMAQGSVQRIGMEHSNWYPSNWSSSEHGSMTRQVKSPWPACQNTLYYPAMPAFANGNGNGNGSVNGNGNGNGNGIQIKEEPVSLVARSGNGC